MCAGAGGHAGALSPFALVAEVREFFDGPVILSGSMATGDQILAAQAMGADLAYLGTRFIASTEANAQERQKEMIVGSTAEDIVYTNLFSGVKGNYLAKSVAAAGLDPANLPEADKSKMDFGSGGGASRKVWRDIWSAGQSAGMGQGHPPDRRNRRPAARRIRCRPGPPRRLERTLRHRGSRRRGVRREE